MLIIEPRIAACEAVTLFLYNSIRYWKEIFGCKLQGMLKPINLVLINVKKFTFRAVVVGIQLLVLLQTVLQIKLVEGVMPS
jgi:hypothetical protein